MEAPGSPRFSVFARLRRGLLMTHTELIAKVGEAVKVRVSADPKALEALEEALLGADVGPATAIELGEAVREEVGRKGSGDEELVRRVLREEMERRLFVAVPASEPPSGVPRVLMMVGVNGTGKT